MNGQRKIYNIMLELLNRLKYIIFIVLGLIVVYKMIEKFAPQPQYVDYKSTIDSLITANNELVKQQQILDSTIRSYEEKLNSIDSSIGDVKVGLNSVGTQYSAINRKINIFSPVQIDSFFRSRYKN